MSVFTRLANEEMEIQEIEPITVSEVIENEMENVEITEEISDIQATFQDIDTATELQEELENKVASVEMLKPEEYNLYVANDLHASYIRACKMMSMEPKHISNESMDNAITLSTEGIKEVIQNIIDTIKQIIGKIINKIKQLWIKIQVMINNDEKELHLLITRYKYARADISLADLNSYGISDKYNNFKVTLDKEISKDFSAILYIGSSDHKAFMKTISDHYNALINYHPFVGFLPSLVLPGIDVTNNNDIKNMVPKTHNDLPLQKIQVTSTRKATMYVLAVYYDDDKIDFIYTRINLISKMVIPKNVDYTDLTYTTSLIDKFISSSNNNKKVLDSLYNQMTSRVNDINKMLSNIKKDPEDDLLLLNNLKKASVILPRVYIDAMSNSIYINKRMIKLLSMLVKNIETVIARD